MKRLLLPCLALTAIAACGKKSKSSGDDPIQGAVNQLAAAYPQGLALAAFPQSTSQTALTFNADATAPEDKKPEDMTMKDKKELEQKVLEGKGDSCLPPIMKKQPPKLTAETCYEFDQDMIYASTTQNSQTSTKGTKNGKNTSNEACLVAFARTQIADIADYVDRANAQIQAMICQAKKNDASVDLPKPGDSALDLKAAMVTAMGDKAGKMDTATIEASADSAGATVYKSTVVMTDDRGTSRTVVLRHTPSSTSTEDNPVYSGTLSIRMKRGQQDGGQGQNEKERFISVTYSRAVESEKPVLRYELRTAQFNDALVDGAFSADGIVNYNSGADSNGDYKINNQNVEANQAVDSISYIAFSGNPETNEGTLSYWKNPGGNYHEAARGMLTEIKAGTDGKLSGCAISGAVLASSGGQHISIRKSMVTGDALKPTGFYHPRFNSDQGQGDTYLANQTDADGTYFQKTKTSGQTEVNKWYLPNAGTNSTTFVTSQMGAIITKQCYKQADSGVYEIDAASTTATAGYDLISTSDTTKMFDPPKLKGVKTDGKIAKE